MGKSLLSFLGVTFTVPFLWAVGGGKTALSVNAGGASSNVLSSVSMGGNVTRKTEEEIQIIIVNSCFGTNLRSVGNPLARNAEITAGIVLNQSGSAKTYSVTYNSSLVSRGGQGSLVVIPSSQIKASDGSKISGAVQGNTVRLNLSAKVSTTVDTDGNLSSTGFPSLSSTSFSQNILPPVGAQPPYPYLRGYENSYCEGYSGCSLKDPARLQEILTESLPFYFYGFNGSNFFKTYPITVKTVSNWDEYSNLYNHWYAWYSDALMKSVFGRGAYMGQNGGLSASKSSSISRDGRTISIHVSFPGENGYCGGYYSPLMVFFDDKRPEFTGLVSFPLNPSGQTLWPEKKAPGYFIAWDKNKDRLISRADELFGSEDGKYKNGFEALKTFDSNGDKVIDARDEKFKELLLWRDESSDGISQKEEMQPLEKRILSISLDYKGDTKVKYGDRAEVKERANFKFKQGEKISEGEVLDIWFGSPK